MGINRNLLNMMGIDLPSPYDFYIKGAEKLGITKEDTSKIRQDVISYKNKYFPNFENLDEDEKINIMETLTHGLAAYRIGDTPVKRTAFQLKDISQGIGHGLLSDRKFFKEELGDAVNNKVGFYLRDKYSDNEEEAVEELVSMINKKDSRLYFPANGDTKPITQLIGLNKILERNNGN